MTLLAAAASRPAVTTMLRGRRVLGAAFGAATALATDRTPGDLPLFARWGGALLRGHLSSVYADPTNQAGPLQLLVNVPVRLLAPNGSVWLPFAAAVNGALVYAAMRWCAALHVKGGSAVAARPGGWRVARRELLVAAVALLWLGQGSLWSGHPAEALTPVLWCVGMVSARRGRHARAGVLFGVSMGIAPWALLATPAVLAVTRMRGAVVVAAVAGVVGSALYAPFVLTGRFHLLQFQWRVEPRSLVSLLMPVGAPFGWPQRLVQAIVVVGVTAAVAVWLRGRPQLAVMLAPMVATAMRVASDPKRLDYYWLPIEMLTVLAVLVAPMTRTRLGIELRTLVLCYVAWAGVAAGQVYVGALIVVVMIAAHATHPALSAARVRASGRVRAMSAGTCIAVPSPAGSEPETCP